MGKVHWGFIKPLFYSGFAKAHLCRGFMKTPLYKGFMKHPYFCTLLILTNSVFSWINTWRLLYMITWCLFPVKLYNIQDVIDLYVLSCEVQLCEQEWVKCVWLLICWANWLVTFHTSFSRVLIGYSVVLWMGLHLSCEGIAVCFFVCVHDISLFTVTKIYNAHKW